MQFVFSKAGGVLVVLTLVLAGCETTPKSGGAPKSTYKVGSPYKIDGTWYYPKEQPSYNETGLASWYGDKFHGKPTANGETYDQNAMTAAHKTLPMPVKVRVTNLENGKQVELRVNDRGPFVKGRIIDLSSKAADLLDIKARGTAKVRVEYLGRLDNETFITHKPVTPDGHRQVASAPVETVSSDDLSAPPGANTAPVRVTSTAPDATAEVPEVRTVPVSSNPEMYVQAAAFQYRDNAVRLKQRLVGEGHQNAMVSIRSARVQGRQFHRVRIGPLASIQYADSMLDRVLAAGHVGARIVID